MAVDAQNIEWCTTEDILIEVTMKDTSLDIRSWNITFTLRDQAGNVKLTYTVGSGITIISAIVLHVTIPNAQNNLDPMRVYLYDIWRTGTRQRIVFGEVVVSPKQISG